VADKATKQLSSGDRYDAAADRRTARSRHLYPRGDGLHLHRAPLVTTDAQIDRIVGIIGETVPAVVNEAMSLKR
jgi:hypothetical protein